MRKFQMALEEARSGAAEQAAHLADMRSRATSLLSLAGVIAAFLGALVAREPSDAPAGWLALATVLFVALVGLVLSIVWPTTVWTSNDPEVLVQWAEADAGFIDDQERDLALHMASHYQDNAAKFYWITTRYCLAVACLVGLMGALGAALLA